ncbi:MAG: signal peptidase I [Gemmatimonadetes bacterium]|nr:signal peptidase I [Gemmatimonadota bacterium]
MATRKSSGKENAGGRKGSVAAARNGSGGPKGAGTSSRKLWDGFKSIAGTIAIFLVLRTFLIEAYRIPSGSMIPALLVGDWLFVNKLRYGPHVPFTDYNLPGYAEPQRGEVVVFESPLQADEVAIGNDGTPTLVKRLVGLPGDTIYMRDAMLYVDGVAQKLGYTSAEQTLGDGSETHPLFDWQHRFEVANTRFGEPPAQPTHDNWGPLVIPPERFFMMGDNRYDSKDGRYWGLVPRKNVRGRPMFVYYSYVTAMESDRPASFITDIRWGRLGHWIR